MRFAEPMAPFVLHRKRKHFMVFASGAGCVPGRDVDPDVLVQKQLLHLLIECNRYNHLYGDSQNGPGNISNPAFVIISDHVVSVLENSAD